MAPEPHEPISEITEISDYGVGGFFQKFCVATLLGTLAGTIALTASILLAEGEILDVREVLEGLAVIFPFAGVLTIGGMVLIGLPVTALLRISNREQTWLYASLGSVAGLVVMAIMFGPPIPSKGEFLLLAGCGAFAGFAAALSWGRWRERVAKARQVEREEFEAIKRANPIHDLIH